MLLLLLLLYSSPLSLAAAAAAAVADTTKRGAPSFARGSGAMEGGEVEVLLTSTRSQTRLRHLRSLVTAAAAPCGFADASTEAAGLRSLLRHRPRVDRSGELREGTLGALIGVKDSFFIRGGKKKMNRLTLAPSLSLSSPSPSSPSTTREPSFSPLNPRVRAFEGSA